MTDNEIIKALGCCSATEISCEECPYREILTTCTTLVKKDALNLIKNQHTIIEQLYRVIDDKTDYIAHIISEKNKIMEAREDIKAEAIKEFATRLKDEIGQAICTYWNCASGGYYLAENCIDEIDNLVAEMAGAVNDNI